MDNIQVHIKLLNSSKNDENKKPFLIVEGNTLTNQKTNESFTFNSINDETKTNQQIYNEFIKEFISNNLNRGNSFCIFTYGQSNCKVNLFRSLDENSGILINIIKDLFSFYSQDYKFEIKMSILDIYSEILTDLLDGKKTNLDIKDFEKKLNIDHMTETSIITIDKLLSIMKVAEKTSRLLYDNRTSLLNEPASKYTSTIFKINVEYSKKNDRKQVSNLQIFLVDFPHSDTVSNYKKNDVNNTIKKQNQSKGITTFVNLVNKLVIGNKASYFYKDSKLTKILYQCLNGSFDKMLIGYINQSPDNSNEASTVLNFFSKLNSNCSKKPETNSNVSHVFEDKSKFLTENMKLKSKIKELEGMISEKEIFSDRKTQRIQSTSTKKADPEEDDTKNGILNNLEKEVLQLKKILLNSTNMNISYREDEGVTPDEVINNNMNNMETSYHMLNSSFSMNKTPNHFMNKFSDSGRKYNDNYNSYHNSYNAIFNSNSKQNNLFNSQRRCYTESKGFPSRNLSSIPKFLMPSSINFSNHKPTATYNNIFNTPNPMNTIIEEMNNTDMENDNNDCQLNEEIPNGGSNNNAFLIEVMREKDDLRRQITEIKKNHLEKSREKEGKLKNLQMNLKLTVENYDKIIQETEENYSNLKIQFDRIKEENTKKDANISNLLQRVRNLESELSLQITKSSNHNPNEAMEELQNKIKELNESLEKSNQSLNIEIEKNSNNMLIIERLKEENLNLKILYENINTELIGVNSQKEMYSKNNEITLNENLKMKNEIISYKNEILLNKDKISKQKNEINYLKSEISKLKNEKSDGKNNKSITEILQCISCPDKDKTIHKLEEKSKKLEYSISEKEQKIKELESTVANVKEYERLIEESLNKLKEQDNNLIITQEKNKYLENLLSRLEFKFENERKTKRRISTTPNGKHSESKNLEISAITPFVVDANEVKNNETSQKTILRNISTTEFFTDSNTKEVNNFLKEKKKYEMRKNN